MNNLRHKAIIDTHPDVMMDDCHIDLIHSLILASKPKKALEIGVGTGAVTTAMLFALAMNGNPDGLTCVDNFGDWTFDKPNGFDLIEDRIRFIKQREDEFIRECKETFDFIVSDADHAHTGEWFKDTFNLLNNDGILVYHDATNPHCPSVQSVVRECFEMGIRYMLFNKNSLPHERCDRGLLVIQK